MQYDWLIIIRLSDFSPLLLQWRVGEGWVLEKKSLKIEEKVCAHSWSVVQTISRCQIEIEEFNVLFAKDG